MQSSFGRSEPSSMNDNDHHDDGSANTKKNVSLSSSSSSSSPSFAWWSTAPIFVINMKRNIDRWNRWRKFSDVKRVNALDMKKSAQRQRKILTDPHYVSLRTRYNIHFSRFRYEDADINTVGAIGCTLSHVKILKALAAGKISSPAIVFEDDARVPDSAYKYSRFRDYLKTVLPKTQGQRLLSSTSLLERSPTHGSASDEWDMLLLGHVGRISYFDEDAHSKATRGRRIKSFIGCHAIVYTRNLAQKMLPWLFPVEGHIDAMFSRASELGFIHIRHHPSINIRQASQGPSTIQHTKTGVKMIRETNKKYRVQKGATHVLYLMLFIVALISVYTILRVWNRYKECKTRCCSYGAELGTKSIEPKRGYAKVENVS